MKEKRVGRLPTLPEALIIMGTLIVVILISLNTELELVPALLFGIIVAGAGAMYLGYSWEELEKGIIHSIGISMGAVLILMIIGTVIGTWILGGTIPTLISYGLNILTPRAFLPAGFVLCALVSIFIGSSFGTIATMGIVLMGVGEGLGFPPEMIAGAVVAGAMFGDKVSPMSDSTNLTAAVSETPLFSHVRSMLYVSGPAVLISLVLYWILSGRIAASGNVDLEVISKIQAAIDASFNVSLLTIVPVAAVLIILAMQVPAIPALVLSFIISAVFAVITQGASFAEIILATGNGYVSETGYELVDRLFTQGGVANMMGTVSIIITASAMGGILETTGVLQTILNSLEKVTKKSSSLILTTMISSYLVMIATGEMYVGVILPGRTLGPAYDDLGVHRSVLSRTLETSATLICGVLPWGVVTAYATNVLGLANAGYARYCYLPFLAPIIAIIYAYTGLFTFKVGDDV